MNMSPASIRRSILPALAGLGVWGALWSPTVAARDTTSTPDPGREEPFVVRAFHPFIGSKWIGNAVAYGPHRDGQRPGGESPAREELREDLRILAAHWNLFRLYSASDGVAETTLQIIEEDGLDLRVMLGVWVAVEERLNESGLVEVFPEARAANRREVEAAIRLAKAYPELVPAVCVGNETQVFWSDHRTPLHVLTRYVREVRARVGAPVTVADDFNFWNKPESRPLAGELDFLVMHYHPLWNGVLLPDALSETRRIQAEIQAHHPERTVVVGETGWAWKGGAHPDEVEKHWGLFRADRTPKTALSEDE